MARVVGIDIGGTGLRAATVDEAGRLGEVLRLGHPDRRVASIVDGVADAVEAMGGAERVGVGMPGFVRNGVVLGSPNFPEWRDVPLAQLLHERTGATVAVENDANAAAFGIWTERGARGDLVLLTLGTGVGGGVVTEGRLLRGAGGTGAELGHIYVGGDRKCGCGGVGCLEVWCSNGGILMGAAERGQVVQDAAAVVARADRGERWAVDALEEAGVGLGRGLVTLTNIFNPDVVVLTGGLAAAERWLWPPAQRWLKAHGIPANAGWARYEWEGRADPFAIVGAAMLARAAAGVG